MRRKLKIDVESKKLTEDYWRDKIKAEKVAHSLNKCDRINSSKLIK
jgi:hypothetical protein